MADRHLQVLCSDDGTFPLLLGGVDLLDPNGASLFLTVREATRLRDAINAALDVHNRARGLIDARIRLDRLNGSTPRTVAEYTAEFLEALDSSSLIIATPDLPHGGGDA